MDPLCVEGNYIKRFARIKEFSNETVEIVLDDILKYFCNDWLEAEFTVQSGAGRYKRSSSRTDVRNGHYRRSIITGRGVIDLKVPRGLNKQYKYSLFDKFKRRTKKFEEIVISSLLKGHSSRKAKVFFKDLFGQETLSHQTALSTLRKFDNEVKKWKKRPLRDNAVVLVLDAVHLKGVIPHLKNAKPVLFAYAVYPDGTEEILDFELCRSESLNNWHKFTQKLTNRGLNNVELIVHDDNGSISGAVSLVWPEALEQQCIFHIMQNINTRHALSVVEMY